MKEFLCAVSAITAMIVAVVCLCNTSNERADAGYAAYVYSNPPFGSKEFKGVLIGPKSTGLVWRQDSVCISVTPYTKSESFDDIRAKDQLKMTADAFIVYHIDKNKVKEFVENYGAISDVEHTPDAIDADAYKNFIRQPFRTAVRTAIARFNGLDAPAHIPDITKMVEEELKDNLADSPFIVDAITIGNTTPPESVTAGITKKVEATQEYERQAIELEIAKRSEEVATAQGRAKANKVYQEAQGELAKAKADADAKLYSRQQEAAAHLAMKKAEAEGMKLEAEGKKALNDSIGDNLIKFEQIQNLDKLHFPNILVGSEVIAPLSAALQRVVTPAPVATPAQ